MDGPHIGPFNIGNPGEFTMKELADMVIKVVNPKATITYKENTADDPSRRKPDITKARELLGWEPTVKLEDGLKLMVDDFSKRLVCMCSSGDTQHCATGRVKLRQA